MRLQLAAGGREERVLPIAAGPVRRMWSRSARDWLMWVQEPAPVGLAVDRLRGAYRYERAGTVFGRADEVHGPDRA